MVYCIYLRLDHRRQNRFLLIASLAFYAAWNWKFLFWIFLTTLVDYRVALELSESEVPARRKRLISISVIANLLTLGFFKYYHFFADNLQALLNSFGLHASLPVLNIVLPLGISFYTFQAMSYTIDVYRRQVQPVRNFYDFAAYVTFFPQLAAGPIERAPHLMPQFLSPRVVTFEKFYEGCYLIFWGLFQKIVLADNLAKIVNPVFEAAGPYSGGQVLLATYAFAFQIFCDFSGYSDMARGLAKLMGFDIMINFNLPYFATYPGDFWKRWHISLSSWLRDYLYIPLGGNKNGTLLTFRNLFFVMLLGGLWHGAAWHFILWGAYHGLLFILYQCIDRAGWKRPAFFSGKRAQVWSFFKGFFFFHLVCLGWLFFRAKSAGQIGEMLNALFFHLDLRAVWQSPGFTPMALLIALLLAVQVLQYRKKNPLAVFGLPTVVRWGFYVLLFHLMAAFGMGTAAQFIYFQF